MTYASTRANHRMTELKFLKTLPDNGGRRTGIERRRFQYTSHIPERRSAHDRRSGSDRRSAMAWKRIGKKAKGPERRAPLISYPDLSGP